MTKHTPGPWKANLADDGAFSIEGMGAVLCQRSDWAFRSVESRANGRLMAAAPELLCILQAIVTDCSSMSSDHADQARAAIAKATGEQP
jgi:hypothetical protein